jgi:hypothetical protein
MYLKRYRTEDFPFVRVRNHGEHEYYYIEESHQPIVTKTIFDCAQKLRKARVPKCVTEDNEYSPLTGAIHCGVCGKGVRIVNRKKSVQWACRTHHKSAVTCPTQCVPETEIIRAFAEMYNKLKANSMKFFAHFGTAKYKSSTIGRYLNKNTTLLNTIFKLR